MTTTNKGYRRVGPTTAPEHASKAKGSPALRIVLAVLGATLLVASGAQLVELMGAMPQPTAARHALAGMPDTSVAWTTLAGAVLLPIAAVLCFVAFGAVRTRPLRS